jgi:hypothetical protein
MASAAEPFYITQFKTEITGILPNSSELTLVYMNYRERDARSYTSEISNEIERSSVRAVYRTIKLIDKSSYHNHLTKTDLDDLEKGHFTIEGLGAKQGEKYESFGTGFVNHMTIGIDDELQGRKLSTALIQGMMAGIEREGIRRIDDQKLFIDADGSAGFWDKLGMKENPRSFNFNGPREEGNGYEKMITIGDIRGYLRSKRPDSPRRTNRSSSRGKASRSSSQGRRRGGTRNYKKRNTRKRSIKRT